MQIHDRSTPYRIASSTLLVSLAVMAFTTNQVDAQSVRVETVGGATTVQNDGRLLLEYRSQSNPTKLYVSKWFTPGGVQVLRDSPHDHVHHRALMYAIGINDVDFWSEKKPSNFGKQVATGGLEASSSSANGVARATIQQEIGWIAPDDQKLATETRTITAHTGAVPNASLLTWRFILAPADGNRPTKLWGRHYFGLGMRFVESMDTGGKFVIQGSDSGKPVRGSERLTRARWCALHAKAGGKPVTVAMFDAPSNPRHPATWFTMNTPFAYLAATLNLHEEPLTITIDKPLAASYGIAAWDGTIPATEIEQAYKKWLSLDRVVK